MERDRADKIEETEVEISRYSSFDENSYWYMIGYIEALEKSEFAPPNGYYVEVGWVDSYELGYVDGTGDFPHE